MKKIIEQMYIVTAIDKNKGYRCNISKPLQRDKAVSFYTNQIVFMNQADKQHKYLSDFKIEVINKPMKEQLINGESLMYSNDTDVLDFFYSNKYSKYYVVFNGKCMNCVRSFVTANKAVDNLIEKYNLQKSYEF